MPFTDSELVWFVAQMFGVAAAASFVAILLAKQLPKPGRRPTYFGFKMACVAVLILGMIRAILAISGHGLDYGVIAAVFTVFVSAPVGGFGFLAGCMLLTFCGIDLKPDD